MRGNPLASYPSEPFPTPTSASPEVVKVYAAIVHGHDGDADDHDGDADDHDGDADGV